MPKRRTSSRFYLLFSTFTVWIILLADASLLPTAAGAGSLDAVTAPVNEVTAPVQQVVEQVLPPAPAPPPSQAPPAVQLPEVKVPVVPVKVPPVRLPLPDAPVKVPTAPEVVEKATNTVAAAANTTSGATGAATTAGNAAVAETRSAAGEVTEAAGSTVTSATATAEAVLNAPAAAADVGAGGARSASGDGTASRSSAETSATAPASAGATTAPLDISTMVFPGVPARVLDPFIRVWPAIALLAESPLGSFVRGWSRSTIELFEVGRTGGGVESPGGAAQPLAEPPLAAEPAAGQQPPFPSFTPPALTPFTWVADENALLGLAVFLVLGASTLAFLVLSRRELGLPMFRRGNRFPWRH